MDRVDRGRAELLMTDLTDDEHNALAANAYAKTLKTVYDALIGQGFDHATTMSLMLAYTSEVRAILRNMAPASNC